MAGADTTIAISKEFHEWLKSKGKKGENYEHIIKRLLNQEDNTEIEEKEEAAETDEVEEKEEAAETDEVEEKEEAAETDEVEEKAKIHHAKAKHSKKKPKKPEPAEQAEPLREEEKSIHESIKKRLYEVFGNPKGDEDKENKDFKDEDESASNDEEDL